MKAGKEKGGIAPLWMIVSAPLVMAISWGSVAMLYKIGWVIVLEGVLMMLAAMFYGMWFEQRVLRPLAKKRGDSDTRSDCGQ